MNLAQEIKKNIMDELPLFNKDDDIEEEEKEEVKKEEEWNFPPP